MATMQATMPIAIHAFFGIEANAPKASAKMISMPVPVEFFAFFLAMSISTLKGGGWRNGIIR
jgi:hypothetical protein